VWLSSFSLSLLLFLSSVLQEDLACHSRQEREGKDPIKTNAKKIFINDY
jgi:hypothetical protein